MQQGALRTTFAESHHRTCPIGHSKPGGKQGEADIFQKRARFVEDSICLEWAPAARCCVLLAGCLHSTVLVPNTSCDESIRCQESIRMIGIRNALQLSRISLCLALNEER